MERSCHVVQTMRILIFSVSTFLSPYPQALSTKIAIPSVCYEEPDTGLTLEADHVVSLLKNTSRAEQLLALERDQVQKYANILDAVRYFIRRMSRLILTLKPVSRREISVQSAANPVFEVLEEALWCTWRPSVVVYSRGLIRWVRRVRINAIRQGWLRQCIPGGVKRTPCCGENSLYNQWDGRSPKDAQSAWSSASVLKRLLTSRIKLLAREVVGWKWLRHENILPFVGVTPELGIISDFMEDGNIMQFITNHPLHNRLHLVSNPGHDAVSWHNCSYLAHGRGVWIGIFAQS